MVTRNVSSHDVANYIITYAKRNDKTVGSLKIQKIMYYIQAKSLVEKGPILIDERIEKWRLGPVFRNVHYCLKNYGRNPITETYQTLEISSKIQLKEFSEEVFDINDKEFMDTVIEPLIDKHPFNLVDRTHSEHIWSKDEDKIMRGKRLYYTDEEIIEYFTNNKNKNS